MSNPQLPYELRLPSGAVVLIAPICTPDQLPELQSGVSVQRQCEGYTWRQMARIALDDASAEFSYSDVGAPQIVNSHKYIGVSHSSSLVALIISDHPCAIDIESQSRNFDRVAPRYVSASEELIELPRAELLAYLWSIKEALYKYAGRKELGLLEDIEVLSIDGNRFLGKLSFSDDTIEGSVLSLFDHTVAYIG